MVDADVEFETSPEVFRTGATDLRRFGLLPTPMLAAPLLAAACCSASNCCDAATRRESSESSNSESFCSLRVTFVGDVSDSFDSNLLDAGVLVFTREQVPVVDGDACMGDSDLSSDARCDLERSEG